MKKHQSQFFVLFAFVLAQIAWLGLLGLWIYWYVSNYIRYEQVGAGYKVPPGVVLDNPKVGIFVIGIIMIPMTKTPTLGFLSTISGGTLYPAPTCSNLI